MTDIQSQLNIYLLYIAKSEARKKIEKREALSCFSSEIHD
jgi:hypothetical protein